MKVCSDSTQSLENHRLQHFLPMYAEIAQKVEAYYQVPISKWETYIRREEQ